MKALAFRVSFFEHLFKVHYTKAFKLSYPTLLPTSSLGLVGNICGFDRKEVLKEIGDFYYGSAFLSGEAIEENITFIQFKKEKGKYRSGVVKAQVYNNSEHIIIVAGEEENLKERILEKINIIKSDYLEDSFGRWYLVKVSRYPYGGQNDFFAKDIRILDKVLDVEEKSEISLGYIPIEAIKNIENSTEIDILPVRTKNGMKYFAFIKKGKVLLKNKVLTAKGIPIYKVNEFYYL